MFCITTRNDDLKFIKSLGYRAVGLGKNIFSKEFLKDNSLENISFKNSYYGEYTFHYWLWKNNFIGINNEWLGFCQYRKFWTNNEININRKNLAEADFRENILKDITNEQDKFESIIGDPIFVNKFKLSKLIKKNPIGILFNPFHFFNKNKRTIKFHFDIMHGKGNLEKAINLLPKNDKEDFLNFVNTEVSFNPHNMFLCKNKEVLKKYYDSVFPWLESCEAEFGFDLKGYGLQRIYGFLAERYMSFWFRKYTKYTTLPILFKDISDFN